MSNRSPPDMVFFPKEGKMKEIGVPVKRTIKSVSGPSEVEGQGVDGLQYYVGKTFWDSSILEKELKQRNTILEWRHNATAALLVHTEIRKGAFGIKCSPYLNLYMSINWVSNIEHPVPAELLEGLLKPRNDFI